MAKVSLYRSGVHPDDPGYPGGAVNVTEDVQAAVDLLRVAEQRAESNPSRGAPVQVKHARERLQNVLEIEKEGTAGP